MYWWARAIPFLRVAMALNPHAAPFVKGSGSATTTTTTTTTTTVRAAKPATAPVTAARHVYCDLDGCLVDFEKGCRAVFSGKNPSELTPKVMWGGLARTKDFYANLDWMPDGRELWEGVEHLQPTILTGLPMGKWAEPQKRNWCKRELGEDVPVITCMSRDKHTFCRPGDVLIDDRLSLEDAWVRAGGVFIHHTSAISSLERLRALLPTDPPVARAEPKGEAGGSAKRQKNG